MASAEQILSNDIEDWLLTLTTPVTLTRSEKDNLIDLSTSFLTAMIIADEPVRRGKKNERISDGKLGIISGISQSNGVVTAIMRFDDGTTEISDASDFRVVS